MLKLLSNLFDSNEKQLERIKKTVEKINEYESSVKELKQERILERIKEIRDDLASSIEKVSDEERSSINVVKNSLSLSSAETQVHDSMLHHLPEVFAFVREIARRKFDRRHFDVQLISGIVLAEGKIAEMKTGEGKTQVAWLPLTLYALTKRGAHLVTVNDYLAKTHGEYAGHFFHELGLSVGVVISSGAFKYIPDEMIAEHHGEESEKERKNVTIQNPGDVGGWNLVECPKQEAYECDVVYGTNNEFGFDYLRDNMAVDTKRIVQKELYYCIVDEVDSILIDEARTPLIISAPAEQSNELYTDFSRMIPRLNPEKDYSIDEKSRSAVLTDEGIEKIERWLGVSNLWEDYSLAHHLDNALKAYTLFKRDDNYLVQNGEVVIIDEFTGRAMPGRRYSEGLHQAIEAKEGVEIKKESRTLATITFQNFFRIYKHLAGMTGTAETEAEEFSKIYNLDVIVIPTNKPIIRHDHVDRIYKNQEAKFAAVVKEIVTEHKALQPILVGTTSVEKSEYLSNLLTKRGIKHEVLNAKQHEKESRIVAQAGRKGAVTIATNMAGRGTDIKLGGDPFEEKRFKNVVDLGGLYVIGTERHESRRIDNQLRGRSGRQGEPGASRFFVALDDEIMRVQGGMMVQSLLERTKVPDDMPIESGMISKTIENAQRRVEGYNFDTRKRLVEYDDVMNQQREIFYRLRRRNVNLLSKLKLINSNIDEKVADLKEDMLLKLSNDISAMVTKHYLPDREDVIDVEKFLGDFLDLADDEYIGTCVEGKASQVRSVLKDQLQTLNGDDITDHFTKIGDCLWKKKESEFDSEKEFAEVLIRVYLQTIDELWSEHLNSMQDLREGIGLRGLAQRDPLVEYKNEAIEYFDRFIAHTDSQFAHRILKVRKIVQPKRKVAVNTNIKDEERSKNVSPINVSKKVGRNDPCPCGSGKKYKKCHGRNIL